jgi:hypothetical protein
VARLNLTIPDALYERLQRLRDRVNVSKVCARALEKELAMLEGSLNTVDPKLQRLITRLQRVQSTRERWYQRGREDGDVWAVEVAAEAELRRIGEEWDEVDWEELEREGSDEGDLPDLPESFDAREAIRRWMAEEPEEGTESAAYLARAQVFRKGRDHARREGVGTRDRMAYLQGWSDAAREIWQAAAPMLQRPTER